MSSFLPEQRDLVEFMVISVETIERRAIPYM